MTLSGSSNQLLVMDANVNLLDLAVSPDGRKLAFVVEVPARTDEDGQLDFGADLWLSDRDGENARLLVEYESVGGYFEVPSWLDAETLLVGHRGVDLDTGRAFSVLESVNAGSGEREVILENAAMGALSPDRASLVYTAIDPATRVERLVLAELGSQDRPTVLVPDTAGLAFFNSVAFSPDGSQIAFAAVDFLEGAPPPPPPGTRRPLLRGATHPFAQDVWLVKSDGSGLHRLAEIIENMPSLSWSGDGRFVYALGPGFLWRLEPEAGVAEQLRPGSGTRGSIVWLEGF